MLLTFEIGFIETFLRFLFMKINRFINFELNKKFKAYKMHSVNASPYLKYIELNIEWTYYYALWGILFENDLFMQNLLYFPTNIFYTSVEARFFFFLVILYIYFHMITL